MTEVAKPVIAPVDGVRETPVGNAGVTLKVTVPALTTVGAGMVKAEVKFCRKPAA